MKGSNDVVETRVNFFSEALMIQEDRLKRIIFFILFLFAVVSNAILADVSKSPLLGRTLKVERILRGHIYDQMGVHFMLQPYDIEESTINVFEFSIGETFLILTVYNKDGSQESFEYLYDYIPLEDDVFHSFTMNNEYVTAFFPVDWATNYPIYRHVNARTKERYLQISFDENDKPLNVLRVGISQGDDGEFFWFEVFDVLEVN